MKYACSTLFISILRQNWEGQCVRKVCKYTQVLSTVHIDVGMLLVLQHSCIAGESTAVHQSRLAIVAQEAMHLERLAIIKTWQEPITQAYKTLGRECVCLVQL